MWSRLVLATTSLGGWPAVAKARTALRSWPMAAAAATLCPSTSPTISAISSPVGMTSYQSPPMSIPLVPGR